MYRKPFSLSLYPYPYQLYQLYQLPCPYADGRADAVFVLRAMAKGSPAVGAKLRATGSVPRRGMAPGSRKDLGCFAIAAAPGGAGEDPLPIVLCESAIDAISCLVLHPGYRCLSTSGARSDPARLASLIDQSPRRRIYCNFDADATGDAMARAMMALHPEIQRPPPRAARLEPAAHLAAVAELLRFVPRCP